MAYQKPKGTMDYYPEDMWIRERIAGLFRDAAKRYGYKEIDMPAFESMELLTKKSGEEIKSQIFVLEKKGNEEFGLRFDATVSATRMFIEKQKEMAKPVKWFCVLPLWRYEQPQKGRDREFWQFNIELFGSDKPEADAELLFLLNDLLVSAGLSEDDFIIKINNRKLLEGLLIDFIDKRVMGSVIRIIDKKSKITEKEFVDELKKLELDDNDIIKIKSILSIKNLDEIREADKLAKEGLDELKSVLKILKNKKNIKVDLSTARGLAYYTGTVFECYDKEQKLRALAGGGRYDNMVELLGGQQCPATGFAIGFSTLSLLLKEKKLLQAFDLAPDYFVAVVNDDVREKAIEIAQSLRKKYKVDMDLMQRNLRNQMDYANSIKAKKVVIVGPDELKDNEVKVKDMNSGKEEKIKIENL